jgi:hypothetical protein
VRAGPRQPRVPNTSRYERPCAVRRSRSGTQTNSGCYWGSRGYSLRAIRNFWRQFWSAESAVTRTPSYQPELGNDEPDPGEVVWAWVPYEDDPSQGKDRPVVVLARTAADTWETLMMSSKDHDRDAQDEARWGRVWMDVGSGAWDPQGRPSEVRLDRVIRLNRSQIRREGAVLSPEIFAEVTRQATLVGGFG